MQSERRRLRIRPKINTEGGQEYETAHNRISVAFQSTKAEYAAITTRRSDLEAQLQSVKKKH